ncbi:hypothetical protein AWW70_16775 [Bacillus mycoides]|uniref:Uncharacterized protein n=1 Tax=Bacillus mycoides TaxID=1405 RepID=A0A109G6A4_BACMY|nr:hypothetical protein [Bacillus mycoides]KWU61043.1 hypothetical protein AWW70_16775 [Bacillus mycoides]
MSDTEIVYAANEVYKRLGVSGSTQMFVLQHKHLRTLPVKHATSFPHCVLLVQNKQHLSQLTYSFTKISNILPVLRTYFSQQATPNI